MVKLQRPGRPEHRRIRQPTDGSIACPALQGRPHEHALRPARTNLIAPSRGRKDADCKIGDPRCLLCNGKFRRALLVAAVLAQQFRDVLVAPARRNVQRRCAVVIFGIDLSTAGQQ